MQNALLLNTCRYLATQIFGGMMAERWGGRHVVGISLFLSGLLNWYIIDFNTSQYHY
jgi:hypothetical protein